MSFTIDQATAAVTLQARIVILGTWIAQINGGALVPIYASPDFPDTDADSAALLNTAVGDATIAYIAALTNLKDQLDEELTTLLS